MLPFKVVKDDIKNGFEYFEYDGKYAGYNYLIVLEKRFENLVFNFDNEIGYATFFLPVDEFMQMSYKEYSIYIAYALTYNFESF